MPKMKAVRPLTDSFRSIEHPKLMIVPPNDTFLCPDHIAKYLASRGLAEYVVDRPRELPIINGARVVIAPPVSAPVLAEVVMPPPIIRKPLVAEPEPVKTAAPEVVAEPVKTEKPKRSRKPRVRKPRTTKQ